MNSANFVTNILTPFKQVIFARRIASHQKQIVIHLDNCSVHINRVSRDYPEEHDMRRMPRPPYSPDLTPSDFYLFPPVTEKLERTQVVDENQFFWNPCKRV
jgi:hypothetical protein